MHIETLRFFAICSSSSEFILSIWLCEHVFKHITYRCFCAVVWYELVLVAFSDMAQFVWVQIAFFDNTFRCYFMFHTLFLSLFLISEAGMLVTKQRKRMLPKVMKKLVYDPVREKVQKVNGVRRSRRRELKRVELTDLTLKCRMKTEWNESATVLSSFFLSWNSERQDRFRPYLCMLFILFYFVFLILAVDSRNQLCFVVI